MTKRPAPAVHQPPAGAGRLIPDKQPHNAVPALDARGRDRVVTPRSKILARPRNSHESLRIYQLRGVPLTDKVQLKFSLTGIIEVDEMTVRTAALTAGAPPEIANHEGMVARGLSASGGADSALSSILGEALRRGLATTVPHAEIISVSATSSFADGRPSTPPFGLGGQA